MSDNASLPAPSAAVTKKDLDYEGRVRAEKHKDELMMDYTAYLAAHPEIQPLLHDLMQHVLVQKPERPLAAMAVFVRLRASSAA